MASVTVLPLVVLLGCASKEPPTPAAEIATELGVTEPVLALFTALPATFESSTNPATPAKVELGRMLYYDTRLSSSGDVSCYVCHPLHEYGASHRATGIGHNGKVGGRNEPTVYNAGGHVAQFWDGRAPDLEAQALGPVLNPIEMGMADANAVIARLKEIPGYHDLFARAFPGDSDPFTFENFGRAIGAFERGLVTPARWDAALGGKPSELTDAEKAGFRTFTEAGCAQCHSGAFVGGMMYQRAGLVKPWYNNADAGRMQVTKAPADSMVFKVPSLRNVEETWPYFHDGSVQRLQDAVRLMAWHQLGKELSDAEITSITTWLRTLTGTIDTNYINEPTLPAAAAAPPARITLR